MECARYLILLLVHTHMQQEGELERRRLKILLGPLGRLNDGVGPGYVASAREAEEAGRAACGTSTLLSVSVFWWTQEVCMMEDKTQKTLSPFIPS